MLKGIFNFSGVFTPKKGEKPLATPIQPNGDVEPTKMGGATENSKEDMSDAGGMIYMYGGNVLRDPDSNTLMGLQDNDPIKDANLQQINKAVKSIPQYVPQYNFTDILDKK
jgi:hypothetical protein